MTLKGVCSYDPTTKTLSDIEIKSRPNREGPNQEAGGQLHLIRQRWIANTAREECG
jgi:hypothetical protein